jgi:hypothetical protein
MADSQRTEKPTRTRFGKALQTGKEPFLWRPGLGARCNEDSGGDRSRCIGLLATASRPLRPPAR